jgi:outer membrane protein assembly factor BamB
LGETSIASPVASDGKVYIVGDHGTVFTLKASTEFEILAENDLGEVSLSVPALSDSFIYFRTQSQLIAVSGKDVNR